MADYTPTLDAVISNFNAEDVEFIFFEWPQKLGISVFDIGISLRLSGQEFKGRGIDSYEHIAIEKACSEVLERFLFHKLKLPIGYSSAVHTEKHEAENAAFLEAIERDSFLLPFLRKEKPSVIERSEYTHILPLDIDKKFQIQFEMLNLPVEVSGVFSYCLVAKGENFIQPFSVIVGFGCTRDRNRSMGKSVYECLARLSPIILEQERISEIENINENQLHFNAGLDLNYKPDFFFFKKPMANHLLVGGQNDPIRNNSEIQETFEITSEIDENKSFSGIFFSNYYNPKLQSLFRGSAISEVLNFDRLGIEEETLCLIEKQLHPI